MAILTKVTDPSILIEEIKLDASERVMQQFVQLYKKCFAEAPYFESYEDDWVRKEVCEKNMQLGCIFGAFSADVLIGFGCALILNQYRDSSPYRYLEDVRSLSFDLNDSVYMSELGVASDMRRHGVGMQLVQARLNWARGRGFSSFVMRTAGSGSNSLRMYKRLGAQLISGRQNVCNVDDEVKTESSERIYLWGAL